MELTKKFADGITRKISLAELFAQIDGNRSLQIVSKSGYPCSTWISGSAQYCEEHLSKQYLGACVQSIDDSAPTLKIYVR